MNCKTCVFAKPIPVSNAFHCRLNPPALIDGVQVLPVVMIDDTCSHHSTGEPKTEIFAAVSSARCNLNLSISEKLLPHDVAGVQHHQRFIVDVKRQDFFEGDLIIERRRR